MINAAHLNICQTYLILSSIFSVEFVKCRGIPEKHLINAVQVNISLAINSSAGPWLALANSVSKFIGCLGCQMSRQPGPAKEDSAFLASIIQWQFLAILADDRGFVGILSRWSLAILADGQEFVGTLSRWSRVLGRWSWISRQLSKDLSVFLADCLEFLGKVGQKFVSILGRWSRFCQ